MKLERIHGQPSWRFASDKVDAAVTHQGGHLAPVRFRLPHGIVQPYAIAPWAEEANAKIPPLLQSLRGDFFCAPFGDGAPYRGEKHPAHGETAQSHWKLDSLVRAKDATTLKLSMQTKVRRGRVTKMLRLRRSDTAVYCRHVISGMSGRMSFGHHATLKFPENLGSGLISTSPMSFGQVLPVQFEKPSEGGYNSLKIGAEFSRLDRVPAMDGTLADLSVYPARRGFEDLVMTAHEASPDFAWAAAVFPAQNYAWFALKDPRVLRCTVFWLSNGGRHYAPWNGRHVGVMGIEDVTSFFHLGLAESARPNAVNRRGITTSFELKRNIPLVVNYIMGVAAIPKDFGRIKSIACEPGGIVLKSGKNQSIHASVDTSFLYTKDS